MTRFSQIRYTRIPPPGGSDFPGGFFGRVAAFIVGLGAFGVAVFLGAIFLAAVVGLMLIIGLVVWVRLWWFRRQIERYAREHGDLETEYVEIRERSVYGGRERRPGDTIEGEVVDRDSA